jgi:hypothetical protein
MVCIGTGGCGSLKMNREAAQNEIDRAAESNILSPLQMEIFRDRQRGLSYQQLRERYHISSDKTLITIVTRTDFGYLWMPGNGGGRRAYLSDLDLSLFKKRIVHFANDFDCITVIITVMITRSDALILAHNLRRRRQILATQILEKMNLCVTNDTPNAFRIDRKDRLLAPVYSPHDAKGTRLFLTIAGRILLSQTQYQAAIKAQCEESASRES